MKINSAKYFIIIGWILIAFSFSCKKENAKVNTIVPTVITTDTITNITATSATSGGEITSDGRTPITARGVCWSTSRNPTIADSKTNDGTGTGSFTSTITGLTTGTTYYMRAYAANSAGTSYGNEISFAINDYLPLKVGAKYRYKYSDFNGYGHESSKTMGECTWEFISKSVDTAVVYHVEQSFTGYFVNYYSGKPTDSTKIENRISSLSFVVLKDGKIAFDFLLRYQSFWSTRVTLERFIQSDKIDTCFTFDINPNWACLRKNVGITSFSNCECGIRESSIRYSLIEGPYY
jgi:hypothetical protein